MQKFSQKKKKLRARREAKKPDLVHCMLLLYDTWLTRKRGLPPYHFRTQSRYAKSGAAVICDLSFDISSSQIRGLRMKVMGEQYAAVHPPTNGIKVPWIKPMS